VFYLVHIKPSGHLYHLDSMQRYHGPKLTTHCNMVNIKRLCIYTF